MLLRNNIKENATATDKSITDFTNYNSTDNIGASMLNFKEYNSPNCFPAKNPTHDNRHNLNDYSNVMHPNSRANIVQTQTLHSLNQYNEEITNFPVMHLQNPDDMSNSHIPPVAYQQYYNFTSSSSIVFPNEMKNSMINQTVEIQQNVVSTTSMIANHSSNYDQSQGTYSNYPTPYYTANSSNQMPVSNIQHLNRSSTCQTGFPQYSSYSMNTNHPKSQTGNHLTNSFSNISLNSPLPTPYDYTKPNPICHSDNTNASVGPPRLIHSSDTGNNPSNLTNMNGNSMLPNSACHNPPTLNSNSRNLPQSYLDPKTYPNRNTLTSPTSPTGNPISQSSVTHVNHGENPNVKLKQPSPQKHVFSGYNPDNLTPSRRMINVMEERVLIPTTGIMNPVPNLMHITKKNNCNPSIMRCTMNTVPCSEDILNKTRLPLAILMHPFRDLANLQVIRSKKIVRCRTLSCRAYLNPFVVFSDQKRWKCNLCQRMNELTDDFLFDESLSMYIEAQKRAEVKLATVEYIAPREYSIKTSQVLVYVFMVDISTNATCTLYRNTLNRIINTIDELIDTLPGHQNAKFALLGYDSHIHLYPIGEKRCQEIVLSDISEPIEIPISTGIVVDIHKYKEQIQELLTSILDNVESSVTVRPNEALNCLGSAILVAKQLINSSGGRITIFNASCPSVGEGMLSVRETKKSSNVFPIAPDKEFYKSLSLECAQAQICVDLFQLGKLGCDLASLSIVSRYCGGSLFYYPDLTISSLTANDKENLIENDLCFLEIQRLLYDLNRYLTRKIGFDAVLRVRYSSGFSVQSSHGNFFARAPDLYAMANINPDSGIAIRLGISDNFFENNVVFFQAALLYTSSLGERRIRVHTLCLPVSAQIDDVFRMADHQAIAGLLAKSVSDRLQFNGKVLDAREALINAIVDPSIAFGEFCLNSSQRLISLPFPYHLRLLPLYVWGMLQSKCLLPTHNDPDMSVAILDSWRNMPLSYLLADLYPSLYNITSLAFLSCKQKKKLNYLFELNDKSESGSLVDDVAGNIDDTGEPVYSSDSEASSWGSEAGSGISCYDSRSVHPSEHPENVNHIETAVDSDSDDLWYPEQLHLTIQSLSRTCVYLLESSRGLIMLMGSDTPHMFFQQIFGVESFSELPTTGNIQLPELNNSASVQLRVFIKELQIERSLGSHLFIINNIQSNLNSIFQSYMLEDDRLDTSYHRFLRHIQRKVNK